MRHGTFLPGKEYLLREEWVGLWYLLQEEFEAMTINEGVWEVTDTGGNIALAGGRCDIASGMGDWTGTLLRSVAAFVSRAGLTLEMEITPDDTWASKRFGFGTGINAGIVFELEEYDSARVKASVEGLLLPWNYPASTHRVYFVLGAGAYGFVYVSEDGGSTRKLIWRTLAPVSGTLKAIFGLFNVGRSCSVDFVRVYRGRAPVALYAGTPAAPAPALGAEVAVNGGFGADTDWTKEAGWSIADGVAHCVADASQYRSIYQDVLSVGPWYALVFTINNRTAGAILPQLGSADGAFPASADGTYTHTGRRQGNGLLYLNTNAANTTLDVDDVSCKPLTLSSMLTLASDPGQQNSIVDSHPTLTAGTQCGHAVWVDDEAAPAYGLFAYHDGVNAYLEKLENGVWTTLISAAATYSAGAALRTVIVGTLAALYYNGAIVQTPVTVNGAGYGTQVCGFSALGTNDPGEVDVDG